MLEKVEKLSRLFEWEDSHELRAFANDLIKEASLKFDKTLALLAVISYTLSKLISKTHFRKGPKWREYKRLIAKMLEEAANAAKEGNMVSVTEKLQGIAEQIAMIDAADGRFVQNLLQKGRIKMASKAYGFGLSLYRAAELTGAPIQDLADYIGKTKVHDMEDVTIPLKKRMKLARELFGGR